MSLHKLGGANMKVEYTIGEWATAPVGGLLVFDTKEAAEQLVEAMHSAAWLGEYYRDLHIFRCLCWERCILPSQRLYTVSGNIQGLIRRKEDAAMKTIWGGYTAGLSDINIKFASWPTGTKAYKYVKLFGESITKNSPITLC